MKEYEWDIFISYSHDDKPFVKYLANTLASMGLKVWFDHFVLQIGDSLTKKINDGLANSQYGIVVLSHSFFEKDWTQKEVGALLNREVNNKKVILPVWHGISFDEIAEVAPLLLDKLAANTYNDSIEKIGRQIYKVVHPDRPDILELDNPIEIKWIDGSDLIVLPAHPYNGTVVGIGKYPVTNRQYKIFVDNISSKIKQGINETENDFYDARNGLSKAPCGELFNGKKWVGPFYPWASNDFNDPDKPVVCVSAEDALWYTKWVDIQYEKSKARRTSNRTVLPIPQLWDYAAFGKLFTERSPQPG